MSRLSFGLLGMMTVTAEDGEIEIQGAVRRRVLARLLIAANRPVPMGRLVEDLWEGDPPAAAVSTLKSHVSRLRRALGPERLTARAGAYLVTVGSDELDILVFEREARSGQDLLRAGSLDEAVGVLGGALRLWRGPALAEVADTTWGEPEAVRLEEMRAAITEAWLEARLAAGETHTVVADAESAVALYPLRESSWAKLITALYLAGRQADALRAYQRLRDLLGEELGLTPSRELVLLEGAILRQDLDLTFHASRSERANASAMAAAQLPLQPVGTATSNLPNELTSFIPRPVEVAKIKELLEQPGLVTLTGAGGTGKTRLALRVAAEAAEALPPLGGGNGALAGVWLCELAPVEDAADVVRQLGAALGCADRAGFDLAETIAARLSEGTHLVVLDNCEHLLEATGVLAAGLLKANAQLRLLATSRSPLGVEGETVHRVPSMSVPDPTAPGTDLLDFEAIRLFLERARTQQRDFALEGANSRAVASICLQLDGIPLALELAAARLRTMSAVDIEARLDDRFRLLKGGARTLPARQQTLEGLIDWSYELLDEGEKEALGRLSVFAGGFDLAAAEAVAAFGQLEQLDVLDAVASLVDKSLLQVDTHGVTARYRMLETVRAYVARRLLDSEEAAVRAAHAAHFLRVVELAAPHMSGPDQLAWRVRLEEDDDNLRLAFSNLVQAPADDDSRMGGQSQAAGAGEQALRFGSAVSRFWNSRGAYGDEIELIGGALDRPDAAEGGAIRGKALAAAGYLMFRRGDGPRALGYLQEALRLAVDVQSDSLRADALRTMAWVADRRGDHAEAIDLARQAVEAAEASGLPHWLARAYDVRAAASQHSDPAGARADYAEALRYCRAEGDGLGQASALNNLAVLDLEQGDNQAARRRFGEALAIAEAVRDAALVPFLEYGLGLAACLEGDHAAAEPDFVRALQAAKQTGQRSLVAYAVLGVAATRATAGRQEEAALLLGAALSLFTDLGEQPETVEASLLEETTMDLRQALGDRFDGLLADGRALPPADAVRLATAGL
jgi:predicted ATPase/DNA-binding SARP family transcriptional activator